MTSLQFVHVKSPLYDARVQKQQVAFPFRARSFDKGPLQPGQRGVPTSTPVTPDAAFIPFNCGATGKGGNSRGAPTLLALSKPSRPLRHCRRGVERSRILLPPRGGDCSAMLETSTVHEPPRSMIECGYLVSPVELELSISESVAS